MSSSSPLYIVENCTEDRFDFLCPMNWTSLKQTDNENVRACAVCEKNVYLCKTDDELKQNVEAGRCVAIDNREKIEAAIAKFKVNGMPDMSKMYIGYLTPKT